MSWHYMVEGSGRLAAISALASPQAVNPRAKPLPRFTAADEINLINTGSHSGFPSRRIVRNMRDADRLRFQMNPPATQMNDAGAQLVNYRGGYFKAWYIVDGIVNYLPDFFDTHSRAQEAAEHARRQHVSL
jgi:hypothetical protein